MEKMIYGLYDKQGNKVDEGTAAYLADKYYVQTTGITACARGVQGTLLGKYTVKKERMEQDQEQVDMDNRIKELLPKGYTQRTIAQRLGVAESTINNHIRRLRKRGEI